MKRILSIVILLIILSAVLCSCGQQSTGVGPMGISLDEFERLSLGMTDDTVDSIVGGKGTLISESKEETDDYNIFVRRYRYEGETGGYAELEFTQKATKNIYDMIGGQSNSFRSVLSSKTKYELK